MNLNTSIIKTIREAKGMTQAELADIIGVTSKAVSKWETGNGLPDISLLKPLASALDTSVIELLDGKQVVNQNRASNLMRTKFYVCPFCGNVIHTLGEALVSCCGITLPILEAEPFDDSHEITVEPVEDEHFITIRHDMTKEHFISFLAVISYDRIQFIKLYPEGNAEARISHRGGGLLYAYCNRHGLMKMKL